MSVKYHVMTPKYYEVLPWIIIFITALLVLAFLSWLGWVVGQICGKPGEGHPPLRPLYDRKLLRFDRRGRRGSVCSRVALLFQNWMTDTNQESQDRALRGHRNAREIYVKVMSGIDARDPPTEEDFK